MVAFFGATINQACDVVLKKAESKFKNFIPFIITSAESLKRIVIRNCFHHGLSLSSGFLAFDKEISTHGGVATPIIRTSRRVWGPPEEKLDVVGDDDDCPACARLRYAAMRIVLILTICSSASRVSLPIDVLSRVLPSRATI